jgi:cytochrome P450
MPLLMLSNMEKHYPEADKFIPERWLKDDPQYSKRTHPFVTMPFGFGPRMCVGRRFAELEIETLVTKVCTHAQLYTAFSNISLSVYEYEARTFGLRIDFVGASV